MVKSQIVQTRVASPSRGPGIYNFGSGYVVAPDRVLTAAHATRKSDDLAVNEQPCEVRLYGRDEWLSGSVEWIDADQDLAVIKVEDLTSRMASPLVPPLWGTLGGTQPIRWMAVGFPWASLGEQGRSEEHAWGATSAISEESESKLALTIQSRQARQIAPGSHQSPWAGLSGAAVFAEEHLVGVVVSDPARWEGSLTARRLNRVAADTQFRNALGIDALELKPVGERTVERSPYWATVHNLIRRTPGLLDRDKEIGELISFATGSLGYRWMIGQPWAGKTALAAHLIRRLPRDVDLVAFFLLRRLNQADSNRYLSAVNDQLARLLGQQPGADLLDLNRLNDLWTKAVERAARLDRHLLLIVDGLDEDLSRSLGLPSVASILPTLLSEHAHVLVTSRPYPELSRDVDLDHPIRAVKPRVLKSSPHAAQLQYRAEQELNELLSSAGRKENKEVKLSRQMLRLLTAARGPLAITDLAVLGEIDLYEAESVIENRISRVIQPVGSASRRFAFAHDTLRERSADYFGQHHDLEPAEQRIVAWASDHASQGWPTTNVLGKLPLYLLESYPQMLMETSLAKLGELLSDPGYLDVVQAGLGIESIAGTVHTAASLFPNEPALLSARALFAELERYDVVGPARATSFLHQLGLEALAKGSSAVAEGAVARLRQNSPSRLLPLWTTCRRSHRMLNTMTGHNDSVRSVAVTADGTRAVSAGGFDQTIRIWDLAIGQAVGEPLIGHNDWVHSVAVTPDGTRVVSGGGDGTIRVWDLGTGRALGKPLAGHDGPVRSMVVTPDGTRVVSGGGDGTIRVWDLATGRALGKPLTGHDGWVESVAVTPDGTRAVSVSGYEETIRIWDLATGQAVGKPLIGHNDWVHSVAVTPDGTRVVSGGGDGTIRVWDLATGRALGKPLTGHDGWVHSVAVTPDGTRVVSGGGDGTIRVWDLATGRPMGEPLTGHNDDVRSVVVTPDGTRAVSGGRDRTIRIWDLAGEQTVERSLTGHDGWVYSVALTPDCTRAVSGGGDGTIRIWDRATGRKVGKPLIGHDGEVYSVAVTPDGTRLVSGGDDETILIWDLAAGEAVGKPLTGHDGWVDSVAVTADGNRVVSGGGDGTIRVWDLATGRAVGKLLSGHDRSVNTVAVTPDGTRAVSGSDDQTIRIWDLATGRAVGKPLTGHEGPVRSVAVTADGTRAVSAGVDTTIRIWDLVTGRAVGKPLTGHEGPVRSVAVTSDGSWLVSGGGDMTIRIWDQKTWAVEVVAKLFFPVTSVTARSVGQIVHVIAGDERGNLTSLTFECD